MTEIIEYITENYLWFLGGMIVILLAIIGSYADKTNFGQKKKVTKNDKDDNSNQEIENQDENIDDVLFQMPNEENDNTLAQDNQSLEQVSDENIDESLYAPLEDTKEEKNELEELYGPLETTDNESEETTEQDELTEIPEMEEVSENVENNENNEAENLSEEPTGADLIFDDNTIDENLEDAQEELDPQEVAPVDTIDEDESLADWYEMDNVVPTTDVVQPSDAEVNLAEPDNLTQSEDELKEEQREQFEEAFNEIVPEREIINDELLDDIEELSVDEEKEEDKKFETPEIPDLDDVELPEIKIPKRDIWKF